MSAIGFTEDDVYVLSKICLAAISTGSGNDAMPIMKALQSERPDRVGGYILEAMHLLIEGHPLDAVAYLEKSPALTSCIEHEEAQAFRLFLLSKTSQYQQARKDAQRLVRSRKIASDMALAVLKNIATPPATRTSI